MRKALGRGLAALIPTVDVPQQDQPHDSPLPGPINFTVTNTLVGAFTTNGHGVYFTSDILGTNGGTGNVAAASLNAASAVPEPFSFLLVGTGLFGLALLRRRFLKLKRARSLQAERKAQR